MTNRNINTPIYTDQAIGTNKDTPVRIVTNADPAWPERLRGITGLPDTLYYIGELPQDSIPTCSIIGARMCSPYGHRMADLFSRTLASHGIQIVSGMAIGIDGYAQEGALAAAGKSFALLGSGPDICYPPSNGRLYEQLKENGGLISQFPPGTPPLGRNFAIRNRLISAFADVLLVIEAKQKSGTRITVEYALEQGKTVYAVPGRVGDHLSDGCNYAIYEGAGIAYSPEPILAELARRQDTLSFAESCDQEEAKRRNQDRRVESDELLSDTARCIYRALSYEDVLTPDTLAQTLSLPITAVLPALTQLVLEGYADEELRGFYEKARP